MRAISSAMLCHMSLKKNCTKSLLLSQKPLLLSQKRFSFPCKPQTSARGSMTPSKTLALTAPFWDEMRKAHFSRSEMKPPRLAEVMEDVRNKAVSFPGKLCC